MSFIEKAETLRARGHAVRNRSMALALHF
jgi:hypothetical protein